MSASIINPFPSLLVFIFPPRLGYLGRFGCLDLRENCTEENLSPGMERFDGESRSDQVRRKFSSDVCWKVCHFYCIQSLKVLILILPFT